MKMVINYILLFLLFSLKSIGQDQATHINFSLFIDDKFVISGVNNGYIFIKDCGNQVKDSIPFKYEAGDMVISTSDYKKLLSLDMRTNYATKFIYEQFCPERIRYEYFKEWEGPLLSYRYIIFRIYNFSNKINYKKFYERTGYGITIQCPAYTTILSKKKTRRNLKPQCD